MLKKTKKPKELCSPLKFQDHIRQENKGDGGLTIRGGRRGPQWCGWGCWSRADGGCHQAHFWMTLNESTDKGKKEKIQFWVSSVYPFWYFWPHN